MSGHDSSVPYLRPEMAHPDDEPGEPPISFGEQAVHFDNVYRRSIDNIADLTQLDDTTAAGHALTQARTALIERELALDAMRAGFANLTEAQQRVVGAYLSKLVAQHPELGTQVASPAIIAKAGEVSSRSLLTLAAHQQAELTSQRNDAAVIARIKATKARHERRQEKMISAGWISPRARQTFDALRHAEVCVADVAKVAHGYAGYYIYGTEWVAVSQGTGVGKAGSKEFLARIDDVLGHELLHRQFPNNEGPEWEREAMTEHLDASLSHGGIAVMDPADRRQKDLKDRGRFEEERRLKYIELTAAPSPVAPEERLRYAMLAYTSGSLDSLESKVTDGIIDLSWGRRNMRKHIAETIQGFTWLITKDMEERIEAARQRGEALEVIVALQLQPNKIKDKALRRTQLYLLSEAQRLRTKREATDA